MKIKYVLFVFFCLCLLGISFDYLIWMNIGFDGQISSELIPDKKRLNIVIPSSKEAFISFHLEESGIKYGVPTIEDIAYSLFINSIIQIKFHQASVKYTVYFFLFLVLGDSQTKLN